MNENTEKKTIKKTVNLNAITWILSFELENDLFSLTINKDNTNQIYIIKQEYKALNNNQNKTKFNQILNEARFTIEEENYTINLKILAQLDEFKIILHQIIPENLKIIINNLQNKINQNKNFTNSQSLSFQKNNEYIKSFKIESVINIQIKNKIISLGINIGASKTVYSILSEENENFIPNVLLMNSSKRIIPSIICYTKNHRLFGDNSKSSLKQNLNTSYNNLSRIIGFDNSDEYKEELKYMFRSKDKFECYNEKGEIKEIESEYIIADYLSLINEYIILKKKNMNMIQLV